MADTPRLNGAIRALEQGKPAFVTFSPAEINAAQSIDGQGQITVRTEALDDGVQVSITDTGVGIAPQFLERIFEPFFTTKPVGKGTGLGLSISYSIVRKHHGWIRADSTLGQGTTFRFWLPLRQPVAGDAPATAWGS